jgi:hypothetical protein
MSTESTSAVRGERVRLRKFAKLVDRVSLGLLYAFVIALIPVSAIEFLSRTV